MSDQHETISVTTRFTMNKGCFFPRLIVLPDFRLRSEGRLSKIILIPNKRQHKKEITGRHTKIQRMDHIHFVETATNLSVQRYPVHFLPHIRAFGKTLDINHIVKAH